MSFLDAEKELEKACREETARGNLSAPELNALVSVKNLLEDADKLRREVAPSRLRSFEALNPTVRTPSPAPGPVSVAEVVQRFERGVDQITHRLKQADSTLKAFILRQEIEGSDLQSVALSLLRVAVPVQTVTLLIRNTRFSVFDGSRGGWPQQDIGNAFSLLENSHSDQPDETNFIPLDQDTLKLLDGRLQPQKEGLALGSVMVTLPECAKFTETQAIFLLGVARGDKPFVTSFFESVVFEHFCKSLLLSLVKLHCDFDRKNLSPEGLAQKAAAMRNLFATFGVLLLERQADDFQSPSFLLRWQKDPSKAPWTKEQTELLVPLLESEWEVLFRLRPGKSPTQAEREETLQKLSRVFRDFLVWLREETYLSVSALWAKNSSFLLHLSIAGVVTKMRVAEGSPALVFKPLPEFEKDRSLHFYLETRLATLVEEAIHSKLFSFDAKLAAKIFYGRLKLRVGWLTPIEGHQAERGPEFFVLATPHGSMDSRGSLKIALNLAEEPGAE